MGRNRHHKLRNFLIKNGKDDTKESGKVRPPLSPSLVPPGSEGSRNLDHPKEVDLKTGGTAFGGIWGADVF